MLLRQLEYVLAVDAKRNFSRAAERCCITQPTLSQQIRSLEAVLHIEIFDRNCLPIKPTMNGRLIIEQARHVVENAYFLLQPARQIQPN